MWNQEKVAIFEDTQRMIQEDTVLQKRMLQCQSNSHLYLEGYASPLRTMKSEGDVQVVVTSSFQCARDLLPLGEKVAVLNFANPQNPGGGILAGMSGQEECLCRCSDLYNVLTYPYFLRHYYQYHKENCDGFSTDRLIYSAGVTVIKSDDKVPQVLEEPFAVDVITCAAPYLGENCTKSEAELLEIYRARIKNILEVSMAQDVDILVLGAFGCGAFRNDPYLMARAFADVLLQQSYAKYFKKVLFAIRPSNMSPNLRAFGGVFGGISGGEL